MKTGSIAKNSTFALRFSGMGKDFPRAAAIRCTIRINTHRDMLTCPFYYLTGWLCPFCGGQRMILALLHGNVGEAFRLNPVAFVLCLLAVAVLAVRLYNSRFQEKHRPTRAARFVSWCQSGTAMLCLLTILILWGVIRNMA